MAIRQVVREDFAAQYLACERELGLNRDVTSVKGSGQSLGHPVGSSGSRRMVTRLHAMCRGKTLGFTTRCGGVAMATALELL